MAIIIKQDTTGGEKPLLDVGEFGYDKYTDGGDEGRVYVGTGDENIPLARQDELGFGTAENTTYDNTDSGLTATTVQEAIDEAEARIDTAEDDIAKVENGTTEITYNNTDSGLDAVTLSSAVNELDSRIDQIDTDNTDVDNALGTLGTTKRYDKMLDVLGILMIEYDDDENPLVIRYTGDNDDDELYRDVLTYDGEELDYISHYYNRANTDTEDGRTEITTTDGLITGAVYNDV